MAFDWNELVRRRRRELGESQAKFGERLGVTQRLVSMWEGNDRPVSAKAQIELAKHFPEASFELMGQITQPKEGG